MKKIIYLMAGHSFLILGVVGAFLPILPTTPFLLLAAFFYSRSSYKWHVWLRNQKYLGPPLKDWEDNKVIRMKAKIIASLMILSVIFFRLIHLPLAPLIKFILIVILLLVLIFIWTRPSSINH